MNKDYEIYIMHYTGNKERKKLLTKILKKERCPKDVFWIITHDKEFVSYIDYVNNFYADTLEWQNRGYRGFHPHYPLMPSEVSLVLKHKTAMEFFLKSSYDIGLFLEDDAILDKDFFNKLHEYLKTIPENFDAAFIGRGCKPDIENTVDDQYWYFNRSDRNTDSMIFSRKFVENFLDYINKVKFCYPIDHQLNHYFQLFECDVYWLHPPIVTQLSHLGLSESIQQPHSRYINPNLPVRDDLQELLND